MKSFAQEKHPHFIFLRKPPKTLVWGGLEKIALDWFERIDYRSCKVTLGIPVGWKEFFKKRLIEKNLPVEIVEFPFGFNYSSVKNFRNMYNFLKPLGPSTVIFIQGAFDDFRLSDILAGFLTSNNHIYMHENLGALPPNKYYSGIIPGINFGWFVKRQVQKLLNSSRAHLSKKIITLSQGIKDQLIDLWGYPKHKVVTAYHGINLKEFNLSREKREQIRQNLNIHTNDFVFIVTARLSKEKRIDRIIEAFDRLMQKNNHIWLLIIGDGNERIGLEKLSQRKAGNNRILFMGYRENTVDYLTMADCYLNSSDSEGLCLALLEAMACGLICICTDCTGPTEIIRNSQTGFLVKKDVESILEAMEKTMALSVREHQILIYRGFKFIQDNFEVNRLVKNTLNIMHIPTRKL